MIDRHDQPAIPFDPIASDLTDFIGFITQKFFERCCSKGDDYLRIDEFNLFHQVREAGFYLYGRWYSVVWRAASNDVADEYVFLSCKATCF